MFRLAQEMTWIWPVVIQVPADGGFTAQRFRVKFRLAPEALRHAIEQARTDLELQERTAELLRAAMMEIYDVVDEREAPLALTDETREALLANPLILRGIVQAYAQSLTGQPAKAEEKN